MILFDGFATVGATAAFNLACTHGRLLASAIGFGAPADAEVWMRESSVHNSRETWIAAYQMKGDVYTAHLLHRGGSPFLDA